MQTLHNFRTLCLNALLMRHGKPCESCLGKSPWTGVLRRCYRGSAVPGMMVARMITHNRRRGTWLDDVDAFVALTDFSRAKFVQGGLPADRIVVKPNTIHVPLSHAASRNGAVYVGRLSEEKGVAALVAAWERLPDIPLTIVGDGPLRRTLEKTIARRGIRHVRLLGHQDRQECQRWMAGSQLVVIPSVWYENFPMVVLEAYGAGTPVVASRLGSLAELIVDGETGALFDPGSAEDLAAKVRSLAGMPELCELMGRNARQRYDALYAPENNYKALMAVYDHAIRRFEERKRGAVVSAGARGRCPSSKVP